MKRSQAYITDYPVDILLASICGVCFWNTCSNYKQKRL